MKSILYAGATLMIGASIYGFVDYKKTQHKKEFTGMYESGTKKEPAIVAVSKTTEPMPRSAKISAAGLKLRASASKPAIS